MRRLLIIAIMAMNSLLTQAQTGGSSFFPYRYSCDDFTNGLRLVTIPTDHPNLVALYIVVQAGSRNEIEPGKSGFAHLFEHIMFKDSEHFSASQREAILKRMGASANAYTSDDRTVYHHVIAREDLPKLMELEADRFQHLHYDVATFKTETGAVLGEYNKNSANPREKLFEVLRENAFQQHTYRHTTMGFIKDIEDMPNQFDYSYEFYHRFYRPEYVTIVVAGDVTQPQAYALVKQYFGDWKHGTYTQIIPREPPQTEARSAHVDWPTATLPQLCVAFHGPAYSDVEKDKASLDLLALISFGENSALYKRLVLEEQKVDELTVGFDDLIDPELFAVFTRIKDPKDIEAVKSAILATFQECQTQLVSQAKLDATRSRMRYGSLLALNSSEAVAAFVAPYVALRHTPATIDKLFDLYQSLTPEDLRAMAAKYFTATNRSLVTLTSTTNGK